MSDLLVWRITEAGDPPTALAPNAIVEDAFALCRGVIRELRASDPLPEDDFQETLGHLLEQVLVHTRSYDQARAGILFRPWLYREMRWAAIDFWRWFFGRQGQKRVVDARLLEAAARDRFAELGVGDSRGGQLQGPAAAGAGDRSEDWASDLERLYARGDRATLREERRLGLDAGTGAAPGTRRAGARARGRDRSGVALQAARRAPWVDCAACGWRHYPDAPNGVGHWHYPVRCLACGESLIVPVAEEILRVA